MRQKSRRISRVVAFAVLAISAINVLFYIDNRNKGVGPIQVNDTRSRHDDTNQDSQSEKNRKKRRNSESRLQHGSLDGGVLPIRRFRVNKKYGNVVVSYEVRNGVTDYHDNATIIHECNMICWNNPSCDAWELAIEERNCTLFQHHTNHTNGHTWLESFQAVDNDPNYVVGFAQREAKAIRLNRDKKSNADQQDRILYILHSHHILDPTVLSRLLAVLSTYLPRDCCDVIVVAPHTMRVLPSSRERGMSLMNPFFARDGDSKRGSSSYLSLPLARAKFPGYKGYLLVNDDACLRLWELYPRGWLGNRSWGTFEKPANLSALERPRFVQGGVHRIMFSRAPYGWYGEWSWWNLDSGSTVRPPRETSRSNYEASLAALNEFCARPEFRSMIVDPDRLSWFCQDREDVMLRPYHHGKADVFYVANNDVGRNIMDTLVLFGEHDAFLEAAVLAVYLMIVPQDQWWSVPYCDGSLYLDDQGRQMVMNKEPDNYTYAPIYRTNATETDGMVCSVIHPVKFSDEGAVDYWKSVVAAECSTCFREGLWRFVANH